MAGERVGGVAWAQNTGIQRVEVRVDNEPWQDFALVIDNAERVEE